jgi:hypothetical protein
VHEHTPNFVFFTQRKLWLWVRLCMNTHLTDAGV